MLFSVLKYKIKLNGFFIATEIQSETSMEVKVKDNARQWQNFSAKFR